MKKYFISIICAGILFIGTSATLNAQTIQVSGTVSSELLNLVFTPNGISATFQDTWTGGLTGHGHTHVFSSGPIDGQTGEIRDIISRVWLVTSEGNLICDQVGTSIGPFLSVVMTIKQGTGIYKNATGQITSTALIGPDGVEANYSGTITLAP